MVIVSCLQETTQLQKRLRLNKGGGGNSADASPANCVDDDGFQQFVSSARWVLPYLSYLTLLWCGQAVTPAQR